MSKPSDVFIKYFDGAFHGCRPLPHLNAILNRLRILGADNKDYFSVKDICRSTILHRSNTYDYLSLLLAAGVVERSPRDLTFKVRLSKKWEKKNERTRD